MKKLLFSLTLLLLLGVALYLNGAFKSFTLSPTAYAVGEFFVDWGVPAGQPIFNLANFAPGQVETHTVQVTNDSSNTRAIGAKGIKTAESGNLADVLLIEIKQGSTTLYGGASSPKSLALFFTESNNPNGVSLSNLTSHQTAPLEFKVTFNPLAGNEYQGKSVQFTIELGVVVAIPADCQNIVFSKTITGTERRDNLTGTAGNDLIIGLEGNDTIKGLGGTDCIVGGAGSDNLEGGNDADIIIGDEGSDRIVGGIGDDLLFGGSGDDSIDGGNGKDQAFGGSGKDKLTGGNNEDVLDGESGDDNLDGGNNDDLLTGGTGLDKINGGGGTDACTGEVISRCEL